jgi:RNase P/RNase MRP subunit p30
MDKVQNIKNIEETKKIINKSKEKLEIQSQDDTYNRKIAEYGKIKSIIFPKPKYERTSIKSLDSGLNKILAKIMNKNKIELSIDLDNIRTLRKKEKATELSRIIQNIKIARKSKLKINTLNFKDKKNTFSLLTSLGASSKQAKEAITF